jgi:hypothetical protein
VIEPYYQDEYCTIYNADCRDVLPQLEPVDLVLTDPPYNAKKDYGVFKDSLTAEAYAEMMGQAVAQCLTLAVNQFWVAPRYQMALWLSLLPSSRVIVIRRGASGPYRGGWADQYETALAVGKPKKMLPDLWEDIRLKGEGYFFREHTYGHPGYTPSPIFERAISAYRPDSILDPFMGTGTSLVAAKRLNIKAIGVELNPAYCDIAIERLRQQVFDFTGTV